MNDSEIKSGGADDFTEGLTESLMVIKGLGVCIASGEFYSNVRPPAALNAWLKYKNEQWKTDSRFYS